MFGGYLVEGNVSFGESRRFLFSDSGKKGFDSVVSASDVVIKVGEDGEVFSVLVDIFESWTGLVVGASLLGKK